MYEKVMCFVDLQKAFDIVPRNVLDWVMRKKGMIAVFVGSVVSLNEGAKTRVRVHSELSEEYEVKVGMHQVFILSVSFAVTIDFLT